MATESSRDEIEALALKRMVSRAADRMERRLDVKGDGKITLEAIEKQRQKEFAALDRNEDGKLDRHELRAGKKFHHHGPKGRITVAEAKWNTTSQSHNSKINITKSPQCGAFCFHYERITPFLKMILP